MMKVAPGMPVLRRITTAHVPTRHAHPEMNPSVSHFHAVFADVDICVSDFNAVQVRALRCPYDLTFKVDIAWEHVEW